MITYLILTSSGGISVISCKHAKSNNRYLEDYNPDEEESYILYLDAKYVTNIISTKNSET